MGVSLFLSILAVYEDPLLQHRGHPGGPQRGAGSLGVQPAAGAPSAAHPGARLPAVCEYNGLARQLNGRPLPASA